MQNASPKQIKIISEKLFIRGLTKAHKEVADAFHQWATDGLKGWQASKVVEKVIGWRFDDYGRSEKVTRLFDEAAQDLKAFGCPVETTLNRSGDN